MTTEDRARLQTLIERLPVWALLLPEGVSEVQAKNMHDGSLLSDADCYSWVRMIELKAELSALLLAEDGPHPE